jgi:hypothetical protein
MIQQINLLEPSLLPKREWCTGQSIVIGAALLASAVVAHYAHEKMSLQRMLASSSPAAPTAQASAATGDGIDAQLRDGQLRLARGEMLMKAVGGLIDLPRDNARRLQTLFAAMPETIWLQEVEFSSERNVRIVGGATDSGSLTSFSRRLGATEAFQGLPLHVYSLQPREAEPGVVLPPEAAASASDAPAERATAVVPPTLYGFVLSSVDADLVPRQAR